MVKKQVSRVDMPFNILKDLFFFLRKQKCRCMFLNLRPVKQLRLILAVKKKIYISNNISVSFAPTDEN